MTTKNKRTYALTDTTITITPPRELFKGSTVIVCLTETYDRERFTNPQRHFSEDTEVVLLSEHPSAFIRRKKFIKGTKGDDRVYQDTHVEIFLPDGLAASTSVTILLKNVRNPPYVLQNPLYDEYRSKFPKYHFKKLVQWVKFTDELGVYLEAGNAAVQDLKPYVIRSAEVRQNSRKLGTFTHQTQTFYGFTPFYPVDSSVFRTYPYSQTNGLYSFDGLIEKTVQNPTTPEEGTTSHSFDVAVRDGEFEVTFPSQTTAPVKVFTESDPAGSASITKDGEGGFDAQKASIKINWAAGKIYPRTSKLFVVLDSRLLQQADNSLRALPELKCHLEGVEKSCSLAGKTITIQDPFQTAVTKDTNLELQLDGIKLTKCFQDSLYFYVQVKLNNAELIYDSNSAKLPKSDIGPAIKSIAKNVKAESDNLLFSDKVNQISSLSLKFDLDIIDEGSYLRVAVPNELTLTPSFACLLTGVISEYSCRFENNLIFVERLATTVKGAAGIDLLGVRNGRTAGKHALRLSVFSENPVVVPSFYEDYKDDLETWSIDLDGNAPVEGDSTLITNPTPLVSGGDFDITFSWTTEKDYPAGTQLFVYVQLDEESTKKVTSCRLKISQAGAPEPVCEVYKKGILRITNFLSGASPAGNFISIAIGDLVAPICPGGPKGRLDVVAMSQDRTFVEFASNVINTDFQQGLPIKAALGKLDASPTATGFSNIVGRKSSARIILDPAAGFAITRKTRIEFDFPQRFKWAEDASCRIVYGLRGASCSIERYFIRVLIMRLKIDGGFIEVDADSWIEGEPIIVDVKNFVNSPYQDEYEINVVVRDSEKKCVRAEFDFGYEVFREEEQGSGNGENGGGPGGELGGKGEDDRKGLNEGQGRGEGDGGDQAPGENERGRNGGKGSRILSSLTTFLLLALAMFM